MLKTHSVLRAVPILVTLAVADLGAQSARVTLYIGPQVRDGFIEVDHGVRDSIGDISRQFTRDRRFRLVPTAEEAQVVLEIVRRGLAGSKTDATVGVPVGGLLVTVPSESHIRTIEAVLRVGDYQRPIVVQKADDWGDLGKDVAKDLKAWVAANRSRLP